MTQLPDSAPIVRADFDTRRVDTVAHVRMPKQQRTERTMAATGAVASTKVLVTPASIVDDWTMTSDGTVTIVRGQDDHIDWIALDGTMSSTPKMAFDWRRMTNEEKQRLADSATKSLRDLLEQWRAEVRAAPSPPPREGAFGTRIVGIISQGEGTSTSMPINAVAESVPISEMPDYFPPLRAGTVKADLDGNVWILPSTSARSTSRGIVYDVVNRKGELFERVQLPPERSVAGFGASSALYLMWRDSTLAWHIEKTHIVR